MRGRQTRATVAGRRDERQQQVRSHFKNLPHASRYLTGAGRNRLIFESSCPRFDGVAMRFYEHVSATFWGNMLAGLWWYFSPCNALDAVT